ncbi:E3 ubiquitin-protein ligase MYLIP (Inducible degrader of the LDL-receptor) (Idol) (Myosin regulatory light chain interacting protein) (MIR) (RING-type E3 ubiquitin transferase MYLIP) [Durusdinium trenchii]|uniref:E3 ubiquitin-protein ligase MYLIP (Inducible degrader of the LDL-receptor) (Idol) (Myosin regulatory light chain interacting protein) (MIR) (RING-type E3 ubiquitin transferase MYLIP) n=1 Tax=Durusdinium trenchii TaxID=1381693 RepID=A0ABP0K6K7_9DINO
MAKRWKPRRATKRAKPSTPTSNPYPPARRLSTGSCLHHRLRVHAPAGGGLWSCGRQLRRQHPRRTRAAALGQSWAECRYEGRTSVCLPTSFVFTPPHRCGADEEDTQTPPDERPTGRAPEAEEARLEVEHALAQKALAYGEALEAERASYEAELARKTQEAEDRQATLKAVAQDRSELASMYRRANQELCRLRAELSQRTLEVLELRQAWGHWMCSLCLLGFHGLANQESRQLRQPGLNKCVVCLDETARLAFVPCGHLASCEICAAQIHPLQCPVCRQKSESVLPIYLP